MHRRMGGITPSITKTDSVFLSVTKQRGEYVPLTSADPLAKDTKTIMDAAGIDEKFGAHALRGSTASKLVEKGVAELNIVHHSRWSATSVFRKYYERAKLKKVSTLDLCPCRQVALLSFTTHYQRKGDHPVSFCYSSYGTCGHRCFSSPAPHQQQRSERRFQARSKHASVSWYPIPLLCL
jgi:hypothetical protein